MGKSGLYAKFLLQSQIGGVEMVVVAIPLYALLPPTVAFYSSDLLRYPLQQIALLWC